MAASPLGVMSKRFIPSSSSLFYALCWFLLELQLLWEARTSAFIRPHLQRRSVRLFQNYCDRSSAFFGISSARRLSESSKSEDFPLEDNDEGDEDLFANLAKKNVNTEESFSSPQENEEEGENDWRAFRAKLVMKEHQPEETSVFSSSESKNKSSTNAPIESKDGITQQSKSTPSNKNSWAYESGGDVVETGTVLLSHPPNPTQDFGYGLGRQFMHKSVILIVEHDLHYSELVRQLQEKDGGNIDYGKNPSIHGNPTKGVILNRPTDLVMEEDDDTRFSSRIWYGGDDFGIHHPHEPKFFCLHYPNFGTPSSTLKIKSSPQERKEAIESKCREVMRGVYLTPLRNAKELVESGIVDSMNDFWVFSGFTSWPAGELEEEIAEGYWHAVSTDSKTLRDGLRILTAGSGGGTNKNHQNGKTSDPRGVGLRTWSILMDRIGRCNAEVGCTVPLYDEDGMVVTGDEAKSNSSANTQSSNEKESFDDLMLREWVNQYLVFRGHQPPFLREHNKNGKEEIAQKSGTRLDSLNTNEVNLKAGSILRASSAERSPFLFDQQEYHKSLILILQHKQDDKNSALGTLGVLLNRPSAETIQVEGIGSFPLLYGGSMELAQDEYEDRSLFVLHMNSKLRQAGVGEPVAADFEPDQEDVICRCTLEEAAEAIRWKVATPRDFLVAKGFSVWPQATGDGESCMVDHIRQGNFEVVTNEGKGQRQRNVVDSQAHCSLRSFWDTLLKQDVISSSTINHNLQLSNQAWTVAGGEAEEIVSTRSQSSASSMKAITTASERDDEDKKRERDVSQLGDDALKTWMAAFFLDDPRVRL